MALLATLFSCSKKKADDDGEDSESAGTVASTTASTVVSSEDEISKNYPGDIGVENDPDVIFTEMGEEASLTELFTNWNGNSTANSVALDPTAVPEGSLGSQSIRLFTTGGTVGAGAIQTAGLYKLLAKGYTGSVFARWYVRYNSTGTFHHSGPRLGGNNPESPKGPNSPAGVLPSGSDFFYLGAEVTQGKAGPTATSTFDFYNYWMHQRGTSLFPGKHYGNSFVNDPAVFIDMNSWNCIEVELKLNDDVGSFDGEIAMWINGKLVSHVMKGTLGTWDEDNFKPDDGGQAFEGFQWRNDENLPINYFQILHFVDSDAEGQINSVNYDHIVLATRYIGPLK